MGQVPRTSEIWTVKDCNGVERSVLVMLTTATGYTHGWLVHGYSKDPDNVMIKTVRGEKYVDPRKLTYWHTNTFQTIVSQLKSDDYLKIKTKAAQLLGMGVQSDELEQRVSIAESNVLSMSKKIAELTLERNLYKDLCEKAMVANAPREFVLPAEPEPVLSSEEKKKIDDAEYRKKKSAANVEKYKAKQSYISVKCKSISMSQSTLARLIGCQSGTISKWVSGINPAKWDKLERIFPGIEQEAEDYAKEA